MTAIGPMPAPSGGDSVEQGAEVLDDIIEQINQSLPAIHKLAARAHKSRHGTDRITAAAREVFKEMCDNPILNKEGDDFCSPEERAEVRRAHQKQKQSRQKQPSARIDRKAV